MSPATLFSLWRLCLMSLLCAGLLLAFVQSEAGDAVEPSTIEGTTVLHGLVSSVHPFAAAKVYARNHDTNMLYTVYTHKGRFRAPNLLPGGYEIWAEKGELKSEHRWMRVQGQPSVELALELSPGPDFILTRMDSRLPGPQFGGVSGATVVPYDEMYPEHPARPLAEATCMTCHGQSFLPSHRMSRPQWHAIIGVMLDPSAGFSDPDSARSITAEQHNELADYLTENFGPESPSRLLEIDVEYPLDEAVLARGMFIEYLTPLQPGADLSQRSGNEPGKHRLHRPYMDNDGNIWGTNGIIGVSRVDPRTATWSHFPLGTDENNPPVDMYGRRAGEPGNIVSAIFPHDLRVDSYGLVFWGEFQGGHLGRLDPATGRVDRFPIDPEGVVVDENGVAGSARGHSPAFDPQNNVWFTVIRGNRLGRWDRKTEEIKLWEFPTRHSFPYGIDIDSKGNIWVAQFATCAVAKFDPTTEEFTEFPSPSRNCAINRITVDVDDTIWYSVFSSGRLGKLSPDTGEIVEYDVVPFSRIKASKPYGIVVGHEGEIWFGDGGLGGALVRFDPVSERFSYFPTPRQSDNPNLDITREGAIIYSTRSNNQAALGIFYPDVSRMTGYGVYR